MPFLRLLLTCALVTSALFASPLPAQQSFVTMRTSLRIDLTPEAIAAEALEASKRIGANEEERAIALRMVAEALEYVGRIEQGRSALALAIQSARDDPSLYLQASIVPIYARLHGADQAAEYMRKISDRERRVQGGIHWVMDALERDSDAELKIAAATLHSQYYAGWDPDADAQLSVAYRRLGKLEGSKTAADRVLAAQLHKMNHIRYGWSLRVLIKEAFEAGDLDRAESYLSYFDSAEGKPDGLDFERRIWVQQLIQKGELKRAIEQFALLTKPRERFDAQASLAMEWLRRGELQKADENVTAAIQGAERDGTLSRTRIMRALHKADRAKFREPNHILFKEALEGVKKLKPPSLAVEAGVLASTAGDLASEELFDLVLPLIEPGIMTRAGIEFVQAYTQTEDLEGLCHILDEWLLREDLKEMDYTLARAIRTAAWQVESIEKGVGALKIDAVSDRFRAELTEACVDRARTIEEAAARAFTLAALVASGLATPIESSATHPWNVPPILPGGWTTPRDPEPYAARLKSALGERAMPVVRAIRTRSLAFDPEAELVEIDGVLGALPYHFILVCKAEGTFLFDGSREPVDALAASAQWRQSDTALLELAHFSISARSTKDGRFRLVQDLAELETLREPGEVMPTLELKPAEVTERTEDGAKLETNLLVAGQLERIRATVDSAGRVSLGGLGLLGKDLPFGREFAAGGGFKRRRMQVEDALVLQQEDPAAGAYAIAHAYATGFGEGGWMRDTNIAWSWLLYAKEAGYPNPFRQIGLDWRDGNGVRANSTEAEEWLVGSAMNGEYEAGLAAAELLLQSPSPERRARARTVLGLGKKAGHEPSIQRLAELEGN